MGARIRDFGGSMVNSELVEAVLPEGYIGGPISSDFSLAQEAGYQTLQDELASQAQHAPEHVVQAYMSRLNGREKYVQFNDGTLAHPKGKDGLFDLTATVTLRGNKDYRVVVDREPKRIPIKYRHPGYGSRGKPQVGRTGNYILIQDLQKPESDRHAFLMFFMR